MCKIAKLQQTTTKHAKFDKRAWQRLGLPEQILGESSKTPRSATTTRFGSKTNSRKLPKRSFTLQYVHVAKGCDREWGVQADVSDVSGSEGEFQENHEGGQELHETDAAREEGGEVGVRIFFLEVCVIRGALADRIGKYEGFCTGIGLKNADCYSMR